ncbi:hypothetical protein ACOSQ3_016885 [Xanthoceras sorbifolium]
MPTIVPAKASATTTTPTNSPTISTATILASSTEHALAPESAARRPTTPTILTSRTTMATHPTAPSISRAPTITPVTEVTPPIPCAHAPTSTPTPRNLDTGAFPSRIDTFKLTQYDEERNTWVDDDAKNAYDKMNTLHTNPPEELQHMSEDEIHDYVIGESPSGYIRGLGAGPNPRPSSGLAARRCA